MRSLALLTTLAVAACSNSGEPSAVTGLVATDLGVTVCRSTLRTTESVGDVETRHQDFVYDYVALGMFGQVVVRGDGNACGKTQEPLPVTLADGTRVSLVADAPNGGTVAVATDTGGNDRWRVPTPLGSIRLGAHDAARVYFTDGQAVICLDAADGTLRWEHTL
jgi:hypothetical protein